MRISRDSDSDPCPVSDDMLGSLYRASKHGLPELIATVTPDGRAALALYCYRRGHLKSIGLAIASTCDIYDLEMAGGGAGAAGRASLRSRSPIRWRFSSGSPPVSLSWRARRHSGSRSWR